MRIKRVKIENFRCLENVEIHFDSTTTLIGPNGVGKSSVLRALDWFFNGTQFLTEEDLCAGTGTRRISVEVEFGDLQEADRAQLGGYAPASVDTTVLWKTWDNGQEKFTGKAKAFPEFEEVRRCQSAMQVRNAYKLLAESNPELELPSAGTGPLVLEAMLAWERANPDKLVDSDTEGTNFFGFLGQAKLSGIFDFVLVTADLRAREEALDSKSAIIGRLLERSVNRTAADESLATLNDTLKTQHADIVQEHFAEKLREISTKLSDAVGAFTSGRQIIVDAQ